MSRSDRVLADAEAVLRRHSERGRSLSARARDRRNASIMRRLGRIGGAIFVILMGAMIAGWFLPLGTNGVMIVLGLLLIATMFFALLPGDRPVSADTLAQTELPAPPHQDRNLVGNAAQGPARAGRDPDRQHRRAAGDAGAAVGAAE